MASGRDYGTRSSTSSRGSAKTIGEGQGPTPRYPAPTTRSSSTRPTSRGPRRRAWTSSRRCKKGRGASNRQSKRRSSRRWKARAASCVRSIVVGAVGHDLAAWQYGLGAAHLHIAAAAAAADARGDRRSRAGRRLLPFKARTTTPTAATTPDWSFFETRKLVVPLVPPRRRPRRPPRRRARSPRRTRRSASPRAS